MKLCKSKQNRSGKIARSPVSVLILAMVALVTNSEAAVVPDCPFEGRPTTSARVFCQCNEGFSLSGATISIKCDFENKEDVVLTDAIYPFNLKKLVQAYVRIANATSVKVTGSFLRSVHLAPSFALDVWRSGQLTLESTPPLDQTHIPATFVTSTGIGIINCTVPSIPEKLFRDRTTAKLLIRGCRVGTISQSSLFNIAKVKYLVIEDSSVERIEGPISSRNSISLTSDSSAALQGFKLYNSTVNSIASAAFMFVREHSEEAATQLAEVKVVKNRLADVGSDAICALGKIHMTIQGNTFGHLNKGALLAEITGVLKFEENVVEFLEPGALKSLICGNNTSMEKNTIHMTTPHETPYNSSSIPFEASCGNPQVFIVMSPPQPRTLKMTSNATWVILAILLVLVTVLVVGAFYVYRNQTFLRQYRRGGVTLGMGFSERTTMQELHNSADEDDAQEGGAAETDTGVSNPVYDIKEPS